MFIVVLSICMVSNCHFLFLIFVSGPKWKWFLTLNCGICNWTFFETDKANHRTGLDLTNICWHNCKNKHRIIKMTFEMCWQSCRSSRMWCDRLRINVRDFRLQFPLSRGLGKEKSLFEKITTLNILLFTVYCLSLGKIELFVFISSVRSSNSHPDLLVIQQHHPLFQITPVLNTGLSLSEPLQLYKGYNAI